MTDRSTAGRVRRCCPACGFVHFPDPKVGVGVLAVRAGELLLVRRSMDPERGRWALPGGFLDAGMEPRAAAAREVHEETGLVVRVGGLVDVFHNPEPGGATLFLLYEAAVSGGVLRAGDDAADAGFYGPDRLPDLAFPSTIEAVRRWAQEPAAGRG